jgi:hypothetical protein
MITSRDVAFLASRILALCLPAFGLSRTLVQVLFVVTDFVHGFQWQLRFSELLVMNLVMATCLLYLGGLWLLWSHADWISRKLVPDSRQSNLWPRVRLKDLQVVVFSAIGLLFFASGLETMLEVVLGARMLQFIDQYAMVPGRFVSAATVSAIVKMVIGLVLMIGSRSIVRGIRRLRSLGTSDTDERQESIDGQKPPRTVT